MPRKSTLDVDIHRAIVELALEDFGGAQIERELLRRADQAYRDGSDPGMRKRVPSLRTIQNVVRENRPPDPSGNWSLSDSEPNTAALVLETIAVMMVRTHGNVRSVTNGVADWIIRIKTVCPDLTAPHVYRLARLYNARELNQAPTKDLDAYLAFTPWRSDAHKRRYDHALSEGWVEKSPLTLSFRDLIDGSGFTPEEEAILTEGVHAAIMPIATRISEQVQEQVQELFGFLKELPWDDIAERARQVEQKEEDERE